MKLKEYVMGLTFFGGESFLIIWRGRKDLDNTPIIPLLDKSWKGQIGPGQIGPDSYRRHCCHLPPCASCSGGHAGKGISLFPSTTLLWSNWTPRPHPDQTFPTQPYPALSQTRSRWKATLGSTCWWQTPTSFWSLLQWNKQTPVTQGFIRSY